MSSDRARDLTEYGLESLPVHPYDEAILMLLPSAGLVDIPAIPRVLFAGFQIGFYANEDDAEIMAFGVQ